MKGKFIVIDGTDGSGKATQSKLTVERFKEKGYKVKTIDFPQYGKKSAGLIEEYLSGKYGLAEDVGPYRASIFYACDRYNAGFEIKKWLEEGNIVIADRYVTSNMGHQGGKIADLEERKKYFEWLYDLEYEVFKIPKPDLSLILRVPVEISQKLIEKRGNKKDIHEDDLNHLKKAEKVYFELAKMFSNIKLIECARDNEIMKIEEINDMLWEEIKKYL